METFYFVLLDFYDLIMRPSEMGMMVIKMMPMVMMMIMIMMMMMTTMTTMMTSMMGIT